MKITQPAIKMNNTKLFALVALTGLSLIPTSSNAQSWWSLFSPSRESVAVERKVVTESVVKSPVYVDDLHAHIKRNDKLAHQMLTTYGREIESIPGCEYSMALFDAMKIHCVKSRKLISAFDGSSKFAFNESACDLRDSLAILNKLHGKAIVSQDVCKMMDRSKSSVAFIVKNRNEFYPAVASNTRGSSW